MSFFPGGAVTTLGADASPAATAVLVLSHVVLAVDVPLLLVYDVAYLAAVTIAVLAYSIPYHLARGAEGAAFGLAVDQWRPLDHVTATGAPAAVALTALLLDRGGGTEGALARTLLPFVTLFAVTAFPMQPQALIVVLGFLMVVAFDRLLRQSDMTLPTAPPGGYVDWRWFAGMVAAAVAGSALFYFPDADYAITHSLWHLLIGVALLCAAFAFTKNRRRLLRV